MKKISLSLVFLMTSIFSHIAASAEPNGTCWTDPPKIYVLTFTAGDFSSNKAGATARVNFGTGDYYTIECSPYPQGSLVWNKSDFGPNAQYDGSVLHLTKQLDAKVTLYASEFGKTPTVVPYTDLYAGLIDPPVEGGSAISSYSASGYVDFTLVKDAIGGAVVIPPGMYIFRSYSSTQKGLYPTEPMTQGYTAGQIMPIETSCTINNGETISVAFGDISSNQLKNDGVSSTIKKDITLTYACSTALTQDIQITLVGAPAGFDATALNTTKTNVGVVMMHDGVPVIPYESFSSKLVDGAGSDVITFSPIIESGAENVQGEFSASATLVMTSA